MIIGAAAGEPKAHRSSWRQSRKKLGSNAAPTPQGTVTFYLLDLANLDYIPRAERDH
jgi:hypothetical protein